ncbi:hypothetical protein OGAPHI_003797 [Ogataea philodendri]|uniref:Enhancer of mRNA-decapping protein 1 n=1 Tax=Ogataea philodendri TaxID=1378263 RepID=A0A9P8P6L2_9ASCO|nr:uncharacterized protein OGAPHI_003797 [Ogataea philodendri]KAH3665609.1 hypothetical protein OGAPHI_003797 [Ogataea philodendri]
MMVQTQNTGLPDPGPLKAKDSGRKKQTGGNIPPRGVLPDGSSVDFGHSDKSKPKQQQTQKRVSTDKPAKKGKGKTSTNTANDTKKPQQQSSLPSLPDGQKPDFGGRQKPKSKDSKKQSSQSSKSQTPQSSPSSQHSSLRKPPTPSPSPSQSQVYAGSSFHSAPSTMSLPKPSFLKK